MNRDHNLEIKAIKEDRTIEPPDNTDGGYLVNSRSMLPKFDEAIEKFLESVKELKPKEK